MSFSEVAVVVGSVALIGVLVWFFFGPRQAQRVEVRGGVQELIVTVKGGYAPDLIRVRAGVPVRLVFDLKRVVIARRGLCSRISVSVRRSRRSPKRRSSSRLTGRASSVSRAA